MNGVSETIHDEALTVSNFEYAVPFDALLVALFRTKGDGWVFAGTATRWNGITICQLSQMNNDPLYVFPFGLLPDQVWSILTKLETKS